MITLIFDLESLSKVSSIPYQQEVFLGESQNKMWYTQDLQSRLQQPCTSMKVSSKSVPVIIWVKGRTIMDILK